ncbi:TPM domain-containing protein [Paenibacillus ferrarius]|uniref:TPM domain-containing protein n=1 Tax=Paenibacillus ferrarius TaxID=1469647 RepID=UPI003D26784C
MRKYFGLLAALYLLVGCLAGLTIPVGSAAAADESKNLIFDQANLLSQQEKAELNALANQYGAERETDIIIFTSTNQANQDVQRITEDFYDDQAPGYDKAHGNAVILTMDMKNRQVYLAGFAKAEDSLDSGRLDKIREAISPDLTSGHYKQAFERYMTLAHKYMGFKPGVNPDNLLFALWFQVGAAVIIGGLIVGIMVYRSGGRITVNRATYEDSGASAVLDHADQYIRTTITKSKISKNDGGGSGGGGGGVSSGGHSHSGSKGSF